MADSSHVRADTIIRASNRHSVIEPRPRAGNFTGFLLVLAFAGLTTPIVLAHTWLTSGFEVRTGEPAPITVRVPQFAGLSIANGLSLEGGAIVVTRGEIIEGSTKSRVALARAAQPTGWAAWIAYFVGLFIIGLLYTTHLRFSHRGRLRRTQAVSVILFVLVALAVKAALLFSAVSALAMPVGAMAMAAALVIDRGTGLATALFLAVLIALMSPFDPGVIMVLAAQSVGAVMVLGDGARRQRILIAGLVGGLAAMAAYFTFAFLAYGTPPIDELSDPLYSAWLAAGVGGALSGLAAVILQPALQVLLGDITRNKLVELEDLSHPLLKQIAEKAPGTWQHSLAMANMAEIAANAIGANGRLIRVGAYYHDLGKSLQPKYYIENLGGDASPHDSLPPSVSCDAIFSHVTEGVRLGRKAGLHERIIDFMHMHHGDGLLEYFWSKCQEEGNPDNLTERDFRYPGVKPQSKETAILAICDAVEAASRTLKNPDDRAIQTLVQRIVYGKLHLGQLDESGLAVADLRKVSDSLMETIKHAHHGRIEYPWQKQERAELAAANEQGRTGPTRPGLPHDTDQNGVVSNTQRMINEPPLDSLDIPRPIWRNSGGQRPASVPRDVGHGSAALSSDAVPTDADATQLTPAPIAAVTAPPAQRTATAPAEPLPVDPPTDSKPQALVVEELAPALEPSSAPESSKEANHPEFSDKDPPEHTSPLSEIPVLPPAQRVDTDNDDSQHRLAEWEEALETAGSEQALAGHPPPPPGARRTPATIELMKRRASYEVPAQANHQAPARASTDDGVLQPGTVVLGAPPATHPPVRPPRKIRRRGGEKSSDDENRGPTAQREVVVPPEAFPDDSSRVPRLGADDDAQAFEAPTVTVSASRVDAILGVGNPDRDSDS